jgi:serine phosphatase RsbU (regulator of sigma subunit)/anti-sigma regulatory factor (Ser/Thr protein kinase)/putative methionine-R-sulfoxide reductase with GAF domain
MASSPAGGPPAPEVAARNAADARLQHLSALTEAALAHLDLDDLLETLLTRIRAILAADTAAVLLLDTDSQELVARAAKGLEEEVEQGVRIPFGGGFAGRIAAERRPIFLPEVTAATVVNPILIEKGLASMLGVPLLVEGDVIGVLHVGSLTPREFGADDAELLQLAGDRIALAIDHARLYESERRARTEAERQAHELRQLQEISGVALGGLSLDQEVLPGMLERIRDVMNADTAAILLLSAEGDELVARAALGLEEEVERGVRVPVGRGFAGRIAEQRAPVVLEDVESVVGVLHVGSLTPRSFAAAEIELLERAGALIGLAVDRARQHNVAELLQRALLPSSLPEIPALQMAARYLPGADDTHVGGDWYDVVALPHARVGIAIGDVVSRGVRAAAVMGQMRTALRAYALDGEGPGPVLDRLDRLVRGLDEREMATVAYVVLDPAKLTATISLAGHLPPLVVGADGTARLLDAVRSRPIGVAAARRFEETTVQLERGDTLLLYTDGLVERRGMSLDDGLAELERVMAGLAGVAPEEVCERLLQMAEADVVADDVAVLAVRVPAELAERLELTLPAQPGSLATVRRALQNWLTRSGVDEVTGYDVLVATGEACANAVEHAYGPGGADFHFSAELGDGVLTIAVSDEGSWRPARGSHRGRGISMMKQLMDDVQVESEEGGTTVTMTRKVEIQA